MIDGSSRAFGNHIQITHQLSDLGTQGKIYLNRRDRKLLQSRLGKYNKIVTIILF